MQICVNILADGFLMGELAASLIWLDFGWTAAAPDNKKAIE